MLLASMGNHPATFATTILCFPRGYELKNRTGNFASEA